MVVGWIHDGSWAENNIQARWCGSRWTEPLWAWRKCWLRPELCVLQQIFIYKWLLFVYRSLITGLLRSVVVMSAQKWGFCLRGKGKTGFIHFWVHQLRLVPYGPCCCINHRCCWPHQSSSQWISLRWMENQACLNSNFKISNKGGKYKLLYVGIQDVLVQKFSYSGNILSHVLGSGSVLCIVCRWEEKSGTEGSFFPL